jgi:hypothetical protein
MTDTRLPDSWLLNPTLDRLSHEGWRLFTRALMYCNQQGTDGEIETLHMRYVWPYGDPSEYVLELLETGWLVETEKGFLIPDWVNKGQSPASQVLANKEKNRLRQQNHRQKNKASQSGPVTRDVTRDVGQDRTGQDTTGQANYEEAPWPEIRQPGTPKLEEAKEASYVS